MRANELIKKDVKYRSKWRFLYVIMLVKLILNFENKVIHIAMYK